MISGLLTRPIQKPTKSVGDDPQRSRVYKLEREFAGASVHHVASRASLLTVLNHACRYYHIAPPKLVIYNKPEQRIFGRSLYYEYEDGRCEGHTIRLNRGYHGATIATLLHELAHYIVDSTYENHEGHGKKFVGVYMHLLDKYHVFPAVAFRALAKKWRVTIGGKFRPSAIRG